MILMASCVTTSFPVTLLQSSSTATTPNCSTKLGGGGAGAGAGFKSKHASSGGSKPAVKAISNHDDYHLHHYVFTENFNIRSYEVDADRMASIQTLFNLQQETVLNRSRKLGILDDEFGNCSPKMKEKDLIWVFFRMKMVVHRYPMWGDIVQMNNWVSTWKKNAFRLDCLMRDYQTGEILTRASCLSIMMNKVTRKLCRVPEDVREELLKSHFVMNSAPTVLEQQQEDNILEIPKLDDNSADYICSGLRATRNDLDANQHVNNVKYVGWILKSVPHTILESYEISEMTLEYKRECGKDSVVQSLTTIISDDINNNNNNNNIECNHLLQLENGAEEVVRGRTMWRPKSIIANNKCNISY